MLTLKLSAELLWQDNVDVLEMGKSYELAGVTLRSYDGIKYLSGSEGSSYYEIADMGEIQSILDEGQSTCKVLYGEIIMVTSMEEYMSCISCKCKVEQLSAYMYMGQCKKCMRKN